MKKSKRAVLFLTEHYLYRDGFDQNFKIQEFAVQVLNAFYRGVVGNAVNHWRRWSHFFLLILTVLLDILINFIVKIWKFLFIYC